MLKGWLMDYYYGNGLLLWDESLLLMFCGLVLSAVYTVMMWSRHKKQEASLRKMLLKTPPTEVDMRLFRSERNEKQ